MPLKLGSPLFLQVVVSSMGILSSVLDLAADLWAVVQYMLVGRYLWAALVLTLMGLSSVQLQLFSWVWMKADPSELYWSQHSHRFLIVLHMLQLGYLYRCFHGLQQGLSLCSQELPSEFELAYADFLSLDLSMLRLFESFLESTPQLTLVLAIVLLTGQAEYYQWFGILSSFLGISWALLDYHRSLRSCLPAKRNLGWSSSAIYFLWNFLLLGPRIFVISLFSAVYPYYIVMHFFSLWLVLMFWTWLQDTKFMPSPNYEWLYRMSVATILYFSWFNISGGRTRGRAVIHLIFIFSDSVLLVISVLTYITWLPSAILVPTYLITGAVCFLLGLVLRLIYYLWLHPRCFWEPDLVDGALGGAVDGALGGAMDGAGDGAMDGAGDEALHGARDGALHGSMDGALHGARDGALHGARDGALHGSMQRAGSILSPDYTRVLYNRRATQLAQNLFPMAQMSQLAQNLFPRAHMSVILPEKELIVTS